MASIEPTPEQLSRLLGEPDEGAIVMINLLRFRERAEYRAGSEAEPCGGREAYQRYGMHVLPLLAGVGGRILWSGSAQMVVIGPDGEGWDEAVLVEYPTRAAFLSMVTSEAYEKIREHRSAALEDSRLIMTRTDANMLL